MDTKATIIVCALLLAFLTGIKLAAGAETLPSPADVAGLNETACMGTRYEPDRDNPFGPSRLTTYTDQSCLMHLYAAQLHNAKERNKVAAYHVIDKPKTTFCQIVRRHSYYVTTLDSIVAVDNWVVEPAECLDEEVPQEDLSLSLPSVVFDPGTCMIQRDRIGQCAPEECQPIETGIRKYRTCEENE